MDRELVGQALAGKVVLDEVKAGIDGLKATLLEEMQPGDRITGSLGGVEMGSITVARGRKVAVVVDEQAFLAWVVAEYPQETHLVVRDAFRRKLLDTCKTLDDPVDLLTGAVIPGVEIRTGDAYLMLKPSEGGREWVQSQLSAMSYAKPKPIGG